MPLFGKYVIIFVYAYLISLSQVYGFVCIYLQR